MHVFHCIACFGPVWCVNKVLRQHWLLLKASERGRKGRMDQNYRNSRQALAGKMGTAETKKNHHRPAFPPDSKRKQPKEPITQQFPATTNNSNKKQITESAQNNSHKTVLPPIKDLNNGRGQRMGGFTNRQWMMFFVLLILTVLWRYVLLEKVSNDSQNVLKLLRPRARVHTPHHAYAQHACSLTQFSRA